MNRKLKFLELLDYYGCTYEEEEVKNFSLTKKFKTICPNGSKWNPRPQDVISHKMNRCGCSLCGKKNGSSVGEVITAFIFRKYKIDFIEQKTFEGFVSENNAPFRYDFMVGDFLLEIHGRQHFRETKSKYFNHNKEHDLKKIEFAVENNYKLFVLAVEKDWYGWLIKDTFPLLEKIDCFLKNNGFIDEDIVFTEKDKKECLQIISKGDLKYKVYDLWTEELIFETDLYTDLRKGLHGVQLKLASELNDCGYKASDVSIVLNEKIIKKENIDFVSIRKNVEKKREIEKEKKVLLEKKTTEYKVKRINEGTIYSFDKIADIESEFNYKRLSDCFTGKNGRLFPKEIEWIEVNGERVHYFLESNRSYIVYKNGYIEAFDKRTDLELYLGYSKEKGNVWVKEGFPTTLDENIDFLHLKGKRAERKRYKYSFVLLNGEIFETNNRSEVEKYFGVSRGWITYYKNKNELPPIMMKKISNYVLTV